MCENRKETADHDASVVAIYSIPSAREDREGTLVMKAHPALVFRRVMKAIFPNPMMMAVLPVDDDHCAYMLVEGAAFDRADEGADEGGELVARGELAEAEGIIDELVRLWRNRVRHSAEGNRRMQLHWFEQELRAAADEMEKILDNRAMEIATATMRAQERGT